MNASIYLTFNGNCEEAFNFYKSIFKTEFGHIGRFKDMPPDPKFSIGDAEMDKVMHVSMPVGENSTIMGSDTSESMGQKMVHGNNFSISINTASIPEAENIFEGLSKDGKVTMPLNKTFWGSYFGMLTDQFGIQWMVNCELGEKV